MERDRVGRVAGEIASFTDENLEAPVRKRANRQRREQTFFADAGGEFLDIGVVLAGVERLSDIQSRDGKPGQGNGRGVHLGPPSLDGPSNIRAKTLDFRFRWRL